MHVVISGSPLLPLYSGEIQAPSLGMAIDIADSEAETAVSIMESGRSGELVCRGPFPTQPVAFWGRGGQEKYRSSYFQRYGNATWAQGDLIMMNPVTRGYLMLGRS
jgi:acetoacetyl-CoA synthetase